MLISSFSMVDISIFTPTYFLSTVIMFLLQEIVFCENPIGKTSTVFIGSVSSSHTV